MDLAFTKEDENFRQEVKDFIDKNFPQKLKDIDKRTDLTREDMLSWHKVLYKKRLDCTSMARRIWWNRLEYYSEIYLGSRMR